MTKLDVISALPVELAQKIFTLAAKDSPLKTAIDVSRVSRRWREIALGTQALWSKIDVPHTCRRPEVLNMYLARAGLLPLQLHVGCRIRPAKSKDCDDGDDPNELSERMRSLFSVIKRYIGQLRVLSIISTESHTFKIFEEMFKSVAAPVLEVLALQYPRPNPVYRSEYGEGQFLGGTPSLKACCFHGLSLSYVTSFSSPKRLYISDGIRGRTQSSPQDVREFLDKHAALEHLSVQSPIFRTWPGPESRPSPVRMDSLRTVILSHRYRAPPLLLNWDCDLLLDTIEAPNLKTLAFIDIRGHDVRLPPHAPVHPRFLQVETLAIIRFNYLMLEMLVPHVPAVSHLILVYIPPGNDASDEAFVDFIRDLYPEEDDSDGPNSQPMTTSVPFNDLQTLTIHPVYMGVLCRIVEGRKARSHPLSKVRMDISSLNKEETARLPWLREHVEVEDIDPSDIVEEFERGLPGDYVDIEKPDFLFV